MRVSLPMLLCLLATSAAAQEDKARQAPSATTEGGRVAGEYYVDKPRTSWLYQLGAKGRARLSIVSNENWQARFSFDYPKRALGGTWRIKDGTWYERSARGDDVVVLPHLLTMGTRWRSPSSVERGGKDTSQFEVIATDATVEFEDGTTWVHCLTVLESGEASGEALTHFWAPTVGKVGVQSGSTWLTRLLEFRPGSRGANL
jgi:hypothetical protein